MCVRRLSILTYFSASSAEPLNFERSWRKFKQPTSLSLPVTSKLKRWKPQTTDVS
ncbi:MAG: hypothetical protein ACTS4U_00475 [Candidatus Hodgkinia cicadicola]